jgi:hypothetical protein
MWLVFLHGPPGCGKLTVGRALASLTGFKLFHNHLAVDLLHAVFEFGSPPFVELREQIWLSTFQAAARSGVSLVFTFAPERTVRIGFPAEVESCVRAEGGRVLFASLRCGEAELERRIEEPSRAAFTKLASAARYRELRDSGSFEFPALRADLELDTDALAPLESAQRIQTELSARR